MLPAFYKDQSCAACGGSVPDGPANAHTLCEQCVSSAARIITAVNWLGLVALNLTLLIFVYIAVVELTTDRAAATTLMVRGDDCVNNAAGNRAALERCWQQYPWTQGMTAAPLRTR
jgi:hypothetical protein